MAGLRKLVAGANTDVMVVTSAENISFLSVAARQLEKVSKQAVQAAMEAIMPGATREDLRTACQRAIDRTGERDNFKKRTGCWIVIYFAPDRAKAALTAWIRGATAREDGVSILSARRAIESSQQASTRLRSSQDNGCGCCATCRAA